MTYVVTCVSYSENFTVINTLKQALLLTIIFTKCTHVRVVAMTLTKKSTTRMLAALLLALVSIAVLTGCKEQQAASKQAKPRVPKHEARCEASTLSEYKGPESCEQCHKGVTDDVLNSVHYTWKTAVTHIEGITIGGKATRMMPIAGSNAMINWLGFQNKEETIPGGCGRCHISGVKPTTTPTAMDREAVDCLICHAKTYDMTTRTVVKDASGKPFLRQDRSLVAARSVKGPPTAEMCLRCHKFPAGGANVKRGTPYDPQVDVHAKAGLICTDCHVSRNHQIANGHVVDLWAQELSEKKKACDAKGCHDGALPCTKDHERLSCVTCHIPSARGLVFRDFTNARKDPQTGVFNAHSELEEVKPVYRWFDGRATQDMVPLGSRSNKNAKIFPFKKVVLIVPADASSGELLPMKMGVYYRTGDVTAAVSKGTEDAGVSYSGSWIPRKVEIYIQLSHAITKENALTCSSCHSKEWRPILKELGYSSSEIKKLIEIRGGK
jgi:hypothetical protein